MDYKLGSGLSPGRSLECSLPPSTPPVSEGRRQRGHARCLTRGQGSRTSYMVGLSVWSRTSRCYFFLFRSHRGRSAVLLMPRLVVPFTESVCTGPGRLCVTSISLFKNVHITLSCTCIWSVKQSPAKSSASVPRTDSLESVCGNERPRIEIQPLSHPI